MSESNQKPKPVDAFLFLAVLVILAIGVAGLARAVFELWFRHS